MRASLALLAVMALAVQPAFAQVKSKASPVASALTALEMCEAFARGGDTLVTDAIADGWDAYDQSAESPFVKSYAASREMAGLGWGDLFSLVETYPGKVFGYCRIDFIEIEGDGKPVIDAIAALDRYDGEVLDQDGGHYGSFSGGDSLLLAHWDEDGFVIQLTTLTPRAEETPPTAEPQPEPEASE